MNIHLNGTGHNVSISFQQGLSHFQSIFIPRQQLGKYEGNILSVSSIQWVTSVLYKLHQRFTAVIKAFDTMHVRDGMLSQIKKFILYPTDTVRGYFIYTGEKDAGGKRHLEV